MKKVSELEGAELDYWVAIAEGHEARIIDGNCRICHELTDPDWIFSDLFSPSRSWPQGGPIIEREMISLNTMRNEFGPYWLAGPKRVFGGPGNGDNFQEGITPLIAAMRCRVASKFGEEIDETQIQKCPNDLTATRKK